ncbi:MAG: cyclic nucleotide-binding domain-containing protein [Desulfobacterales bacterium]|jgi:CRP-like cAMP-binding protein|nr:cyclic nucleotide-binding domain-containing protein [Desulfobacterales bacterium]
MESRFIIIANSKCPIYQAGDELNLNGRSLALMGKPACLTLMDDLIQAVETITNPKNFLSGQIPDELFNCSGPFTGCVGTIRIRLCANKAYPKANLKKIEDEITAAAGKLSNLSIFKTLGEDEIRDIVTHFRIKAHPKGEIILKKGEPGIKLFIILSGEVEVVGDYDVVIATLGKGDIFGEMSLLSGNPVNSTIRVSQNSKIMCMNGNHFRMMLNRFPSIQMYFARLLVDRLAKSNIERIHHLSKGMTGSFSEISPPELFQALNMAQKTGILILYLSDGRAMISFRNGDVVWAEYNDRTGIDAFFEIVKQVRGNFKFDPALPKEQAEAPVLGDFMYLLMEGLNRLDEESIRASKR